MRSAPSGGLSLSSHPQPVLSSRGGQGWHQHRLQGRQVSSSRKMCAETCVYVCVNSLSVQYGQLYSLECKGPRSEKENRRPLTSPLTWLGSTFARSSCSDPPEKQPLEGSRDSPVPLSPSAAGSVTHLCAASCYPGHGTHLRLHEERCETAS